MKKLRQVTMWLIIAPGVCVFFWLLHWFYERFEEKTIYSSGFTSENFARIKIDMSLETALSVLGPPLNVSTRDAEGGWRSATMNEAETLPGGEFIFHYSKQADSEIGWDIVTLNIQDGKVLKKFRVRVSD